jgi:hypothetical protein
LTTSFEDNYAIGKCKKSVVLAHADVSARVMLRSALANNDIACDDTLTTKDLHAKSFAF